MLKTASAWTRSAGFSLLEMMMSIAVLSILLTLAMPSFQAWLRNTEIRNAAESILTGIQRARAEAVGRNTTVSFVMGADSSWSVAVVAPASLIETRPASEGSQNVTRAVQPGGATTISFNNLGIVAANGDGTATLTQVDFAAVGASRSLRIVLGAGGTAKMCDPSLPAGSSLSAC